MDFKAAPFTKDSVLSPEELIKRLSPHIGEHIVLTGKPRTDGAKIRKMVSEAIRDDEKQLCNCNDYIIIPKRRKGVPKILAELIDTYIVTSGDKYNLQVWNRPPNGDVPLVQYANGEIISPKDIRLVLVKIDLERSVIGSIVILTPQYIEEHIGPFGKPTKKNQLLISDRERELILCSGGFYFNPDTEAVSAISRREFVKPSKKAQEFDIESILSLDVIGSIAKEHLLGKEILGKDTKTRGQYLERMVLNALGYGEESELVGDYPDIPNQLLEVKTQDSQTIDLGKFSPQYEEQFCPPLQFTTKDTRYLIALTNPTKHIIEGIILSCGQHLEDRFTYVSEESNKWQRYIKMSFFDKYDGQCVFNP